MTFFPNRLDCLLLAEDKSTELGKLQERFTKLRGLMVKLKSDMADLKQEVGALE